MRPSPPLWVRPFASQVERAGLLVLQPTAAAWPSSASWRLRTVEELDGVVMEELDGEVGAVVCFPRSSPASPTDPPTGDVVEDRLAHRSGGRQRIPQ